MSYAGSTGACGCTKPGGAAFPENSKVGRLYCIQLVINIRLRISSMYAQQKWNENEAKEFDFHVI
ncbi:hypothetical protein CCY01nite_36900 [Chitinophaga cymbidii]|uniref:Uncharacterized protein n=1 Tax=Chitinophaga cymbidii TaxID=1096750 RepID=A0A512RNZ8_9BACT|nr:hypothetical protein CCY01nite_36900 [Chitinophaga cymbidii]